MGKTRLNITTKPRRKSVPLELKSCILLAKPGLLCKKKIVRQNLPKTTVEKEAWCWSLYIPAGQRHHSTCICLWADLCGGGTVHKEGKVIYNREFKRQGKKSLIVAFPAFTHKTLPSLISVFRNTMWVMSIVGKNLYNGFQLYQTWGPCKCFSVEWYSSLPYVFFNTFVHIYYSRTQCI